MLLLLLQSLLAPPNPDTGPGSPVNPASPTGGVDDIRARLRRLIPRTWFPAIAPVFDAALHGVAWALNLAFDLIAFVKLQARLATATGGYLDFAARDFFGDGLQRFTGETDTAYRLRLRREVLRRRNTRQALKDVVRDLTGREPTLFEPFNTTDCGGWGTPALAYGVAGLYGSENAPYEVWVKTTQPEGYGIPNRGGWGSEVGGWGVGNFSFVGDDEITGAGQITDILAALEQVRAAGVTVYVEFSTIGL